MDYLTESNWNPRKLQYEIGEDVKVKIWACRDRMRCERESCQIGQINLAESKGMAIQIATPFRQSKRSIPKSKLEMLRTTPRELAESLVSDAVSE